MMKYNSSLKLSQKTTTTLNTEKTYLAYTITLGRGVLKYDEETWYFFYDSSSKRKKVKSEDLKYALLLG